MTNRTITFRAPLLLGISFALAACDNQPVGVESRDEPSPLWSQDDLAGTYEGTVQEAGDVNTAGEAIITIEQTGQSSNDVFGDLGIDAQFAVGDGDIQVVFETTYTGTVRQDDDLEVVLTVENPDCAGTTVLAGIYSPAESSIGLRGRYVHRDPDSCEAVATIDLAITVHKSD